MAIDTDVDPIMTPLLTSAHSTSSQPSAQLATPAHAFYGVIALAAAFGVELMLAAFVAWGRLALPNDQNQFTSRAWSMMRPERDLKIYVAGIALTFLLVSLLCSAWTRFARRGASEMAAVAQVALAIVGLIAFLFILSVLLPLDKAEERPLVGLASGVWLILVGISTIAIAVADASFGLSDRLKGATVWIGPALIALSIRLQLLLAPAAVELEMLIVLAMIWYWLVVRRRAGQEWNRNALRRSAILAAAGVGSFAIYLTLLPARTPTVTGSLIQDPLDYRTRIPVFAMALWLLLDVHWSAAPSKIAAKWSRRFVDIVVPLLLCASIFIPRAKWMILTGSFLGHDELHHWNFFALGPALAFAHGHALVTEIYSQYGVGWPMLFASLRRCIRLSYANLVGCGIIYGCIYFVAVYLFLRLLLRDAIWAACGAILAASLQIFSGLGQNDIIWNFPSSTMLRHPLDIWFLMVLLAHARLEQHQMGGRRWFIFAGALCGVAVLFELDTGIDLLIILSFYGLLRQTVAPTRKNFRALCVDLTGAFAAAASVWLFGMALASRGTILKKIFWSGYFEGLQNQAFSGFGLLPIADVSGFGMAVFAGMLFIYFFAIALSVARLGFRTQPKTGSTIDLFLATISAYGLGLLLLFVGRSHELNLFHPMVPLAIVIVILLHNFRETVAADVKWTSFPWVLGAALLALLWTKPEFVTYPSLVESVLIHTDGSSGSLSLGRGDLGGLSLSARRQIANTQAIVTAMEHLPAHDQSIAVLDDRDTLLYLLSNRAPWSRYTSLFHCLLTRDSLVQTERELLERRPRFIVIRSAPPKMVPPKKWDFTDTWTSFHRFLPQHYHRIEKVGGYEFWRWTP